MKEEIEYNLNKVHIAKRLLTIESYINGYYGCNTRELGKKSKKYVNTEYLGLIPIVYKRLFGPEVIPVPYSILSIMLGRERTTGYSWERKAQGFLDIYPSKRMMFDSFLESNKDDILNDCIVNKRLLSNYFVQVISTFPSEKLQPKKIAQQQQTT